MTDDIVQRLRHAAECPSCGYTYHDDADADAADEIERLRAENARLTTENGMLRQDLAETRDLYDQWRQHRNTGDTP